MSTKFGWCFGPEGSTGYHDSCPYTVEWLDNREQAKDSERWAIHHEKPLHNLTRPRMECC